MSEEEINALTINLVLDNLTLYGKQKLIEYIEQLQQENKKLKDNWNKLKELCKERNKIQSGDDCIKNAIQINLIVSEMIKDLEDK